MSHKRTDIRNALKDLLTGSSPTYATSAGANVYTNRVYNHSKIKLPTINIFEESESANTRDANTRLYSRTLTMKIEVRVEANEDWDEALDDILLQIEDLIAANRQLGGKVSASKYTGTEFQFEPGEKMIGLGTLTYELIYFT